MLIAKVVKYGNSQAILMPDGFDVEEKEFILKEYDNCLILKPVSDHCTLLLHQCSEKMDEDTHF